VTCGAFDLFATGVGSSDLAAALITGEIWLRVPETIKVVLSSTRAESVSAKDIALELVRRIGSDGANFQSIEFHGPGISQLTIEDRMVLSNLAVEMGAKAAIVPFDDTTHAYLADRSSRSFSPVFPDVDARYARALEIDLAALSPRIALPHAPDRVFPLEHALGIAVHMVFIAHAQVGVFPIFAQRWLCWSGLVVASRRICSWCSHRHRGKYTWRCARMARWRASKRWAQRSRCPAAARAAARAASFRGMA
jgi:3-isopropylmalate/(R)-2-methylmalate dehydratase large subunit